MRYLREAGHTVRQANPRYGTSTARTPVSHGG